MRNLNFKLIRKTLEWLHRRRGEATMLLPIGIPNDSYRFFKIYGANTDISAEGVGIYDENSAAYSLPIHMHGKSLMGGEEFVEIHSSLGVSKTFTVSSGLYSTTPLPDYNGTVIIGPKHVKFKKNTPYTLALHLKYFTSATKRSIAMRFDYSDGTYDAPVIASSAREFYMCFTSNPSKTLVSISSHAESSSNVRYYVDGFGLFEGEYSEYSEIFETYNGSRAELHIDAPLRKIDSSTDELDVIDGIVTRKIHVERIDDSSEMTTLDDGVFEIYLSRPIRASSRIISPFSQSGEDDSLYLYSRDDGEALLLKAPSYITSLSDMRDYLSENPFNAIYVLRDAIYGSVSPISLEAFETEVTMEILTDREPSKIVAEYI